MAQASSSQPLSEEDSMPVDERRAPSSERGYNGHFNDQRATRPSRSTGSYREPNNFSNLDEVAAPPPIENPDDRETYRRQSTLEDTRPQSRPEHQEYIESKASHQDEPVRKRRSTPRSQDRRSGEQDLTEVAAPPPVQKSLDEEAGTGHQRFLEDEELQNQNSDEAPQPSQQKPPEDDSQEAPKWLTEIYTISYLIFFAIMGTLARLGVQWLTFYPGTPVVTPVIWANFAGSLIMGFLSEDEGLFRNKTSTTVPNGQPAEKQRRSSKIAGDLDEQAKQAHNKRKKTIPLYIGLATGFCGSFTSFSSFARDFFLAISHNLPTPIDHPHPGIAAPRTDSVVPRNAGYSIEAFLHVVITTLALSLGGLIAGAQLAIFLDPITPRIHGSFIKKVVDRAMVILALGCWLGAILLAIFPPSERWRGQAVFALVFAPPGCLLRFYASLKLNALVPAFPLGTFAVNMFGTAIEGMCFDIQHVGVGIMGRVGGGVVGCQVLQGIMDGFCGCLTTVSTWVAEINGLKRKHGWGYALGSVVGALCLMVVIMGGVRWSAGFSVAACNTGYVSKIHG